jgi:hypothetical protein
MTLKRFIVARSSNFRLLTIFLAFVLLVPIISTIYSNSFEINQVNCSALGSYLKDDTIYFNNPENLGGEQRWGNWLSPYFHAIGLAILGNLNFVNKEGKSEISLYNFNVKGFLQDEPYVLGKVPLLVGHKETKTWLKYLPRKLDRNSNLPIGKSVSFVDVFSRHYITHYHQVSFIINHLSFIINHLSFIINHLSFITFFIFKQ